VDMIDFSAVEHRRHHAERDVYDVLTPFFLAMIVIAMTLHASRARPAAPSRVAFLTRLDRRQQNVRGRLTRRDLDAAGVAIVTMRATDRAMAGVAEDAVRVPA